jgi:hypothetical protein
LDLINNPLGWIISAILLPSIGALWFKKADNSSVDTKIETVNEALDGLEKDNGHLREWLDDHQREDREMFREQRASLKAIQDQLTHNFELLITEIKRNGNGSH